MAMRLEMEKTNMLMRAVFASAMLIGLAGTAEAETRIIYPPHSYQPAPKVHMTYVWDNGCGCHHYDGHSGYLHGGAAHPHMTHMNVAAGQQSSVLTIPPPAPGQ